jgi:cbb3-type cytochrome oxidase subunit 3
MSLSELMSNMNLTFWPQVALVIFMVIFVGVVFKTFAKSQQSKHEEASRLPLEGDEPTREVNGNA